MPRGRKEGRSGDTARSVYQLRVTLIDSRPPIWRRVQVESGITLEGLHHTLQVVMGWTNSHMHGFRVPQRVQPGARPRLLPVESTDEKATRLGNLLRRPRDWCIYDYDFGDGWEHQLLLETVIARSPSARYPMVLAGRGACPPEDVGGLPGYYHFLQVITDPKHPEHEEMLEWVSGTFDPTAFNAHEVNRTFHGGWGAAEAGCLTSQWSRPRVAFARSRLLTAALGGAMRYDIAHQFEPSPGRRSAASSRRSSTPTRAIRRPAQAAAPR